ncbi:UDP-galactopyranose mutase [Achromobacter kerstersii]|uniref:UDP-galactopyranose mutase n=1 Tax=Achromobacter kerstersii TaxID=1353890 RepID=A0A6S7A6G4_9BURK|nr:UDP-galactopyranose mutase [Achromobacter kerstersii]CAB3713581.1 UDP-galactopyranose mutase [Achromobacter kerstersii]HBL66296.1 UDP-galactopyranose mutase [Achromobacter sp.]
MNNYDVVIVGTGFAGSILAERLASQSNKRVLLIEQRDHIAGNMYDYRDDHGVMVHKYGPHLFRTNSPRVLSYISQFTDWEPYQHRVLAHVQGQLVPVPFNLTSLEKLLPEQAADLKQLLISEFGMDVKVPVSVLRKHSDSRVRDLGEFIFQNIYLNYTTKQWGDKPENLDFETITARVPVHLSYDDRYFQESHQALPKKGYTAMFANMLSSPNIEVRLNTKAHDVLRFDVDTGKILLEGEEFTGDVIYTGAVDELFNYAYGELPYRSLRFDLETHDMDLYQPTATVNYPNSEEFTRITEYKHLMGEKPEKTTIMKEYPQEYDRNVPSKSIPYYPIPKDTNAELYARYVELAETFANLKLVGRLAEYRYYDMNNIIERALDVFDSDFDENKKK